MIAKPFYNALQFFGKIHCFFFGHQWKVFPTKPYTSYACDKCGEGVR